MKPISLFIFDLDGTLIDSKEDIAGSVNHTMREIGLPPVPDDVICSFVGNGVTPLIRQSVESALPSAGSNPAPTFEDTLRIFMEHYDHHLLERTRPFPGIPEVLEKFRASPKVVVTNKSQAFSEKILKGLGLAPHFRGIFGGDTNFPKKPDSAVVHHLLKSFGVAPGKTVIIGDSRVDIETGKNAGILTCGVAYGFRPRRELEQSACDYLINRPEDLTKLFKTP